MKVIICDRNGNQFTCNSNTYILPLNKIRTKQ